MTVERTVDYMEHWIELRDECSRQVVVTGFHGLMAAHKDPQLRSVLNAADLWIPDGIAPVLIARLRGRPEAVRAPGVELMHEFFHRSAEKTYSSYFYGDTEETLAGLLEMMSAKYPHHRIVGSHSPPFRAMTPEEQDETIDRINAAQPDVLWVALGAPKQDVWISERLSRLQVPIAIGVGAAFGFLAGTVTRCPGWIGDAGFEWAYRLMREPKKLWRRDLLDGPRFLFHAGMELLRDETSIVDPRSNYKRPS